MNEREAAELRKTFVAVLGHDVRSPLGAIIKGAEIMSQHEPPPRAAGVVEMIGGSACRIADMIDDGVDFAHGKMAGGLTLQRRLETDLAKALKQVSMSSEVSTRRGRLLAPSIRRRRCTAMRRGLPCCFPLL